MRPANLEIIGNELAIKWEDGSETFLSLEFLRRHCPCAGCQGETDVLGNVYKNPAKPLSPMSYHVMRWVNVGSYAVQPVWADGHATGIFSFDYLKKLDALQKEG